MPFGVMPLLPFSVIPQFRVTPVCEMTIYRIGLLPFSMFKFGRKTEYWILSRIYLHMKLGFRAVKARSVVFDKMLATKLKENAKYPHSTCKLSESTHINKNSVFFTKRSASLKCTPWPRLSPKPREMKWRSERRVLYWLLSIAKIWERIWRQVFIFLRQTWSSHVFSSV